MFQINKKTILSSGVDKNQQNNQESYLNSFVLDLLSNPNGNGMLNSLNISDDENGISTTSILRAHLSRIALLLLFFAFGHLYEGYQACSKYLLSFFSILRFEYGRANWLGVLSVPYSTLYKFFHLEFSGYSIEDAFEELSNDSFQNYFKHCVPNSVGLVLHQNLFSIEIPPKVPKPYVAHDKKIVVPSKKEIQLSIGLRNEYLTTQSIYRAAEEIKILSEVTRYILWMSILSLSLPQIQFLTIYELTGCAWNDELALTRLKNSILMELNTLKSCTKCGNIQEYNIPNIKMVDVFSNNTIMISSRTQDKHYGIQETETQEMDEVDLATENEENDLNTIVVFLSDRRLTQNNIARELDCFPPNPTLTIVPDLKYGNQLFGYLPRLEEHETQLYITKSRFSFKLLMKALYSLGSKKSKRENLEMNLKPNGLNGSNTSDSSIVSSVLGFPRSYWNRLKNLRLFDLNSAVT